MSFDLESALARLSRTPDDVASLVGGLASPTLTRKLSEGAFSILENVWHLRDIEAEGFTVRIRRLLAEEAPFLPDVPGDRLAIERRYNELPLEEGLDGFRAARAENLFLLRDAHASLSRSGQLEGVGPVTLAELVGRMLEHDAGHLEEMARLRHPDSGPVARRL